MNRKRFILVLAAFLILVSILGAYATNDNSYSSDINYLLDSTNESDLTAGCCSVVCQLDGNNSILAFRRDAGYSADITIEKINWHGKPAIKQYKEEQGYFCQVIVTNDGWVIGYGGLDDGIDNQRIENMTADMVLNNTISNSTLQQIQDIKNSYGRGHVVIKAPNGTYGVAMATTHFTGKLNNGDYISVPNKYTYLRTGDIELSAPDKVKILNKLELSDAYGLIRRDITTFAFHEVDNDTFKGNVTDIYISNDDGSYWGMETGGACDDVYFNDTVFKKGDIPIAPEYKKLGTVEFEEDGGSWFDAILSFLSWVATIILVIIIFVLVVRLINKIRYARRRR